MPLVELKKQLASQIIDLLKVEEFRVNYARYDERTRSWSVAISYIVELQPDQGVIFGSRGSDKHFKNYYKEKQDGLES